MRWSSDRTAMGSSRTVLERWYSVIVAPPHVGSKQRKQVLVLPGPEIGHALDDAGEARDHRGRGKAVAGDRSRGPAEPRHPHTDATGVEVDRRSRVDPDLV